MYIDIAREVSGILGSRAQELKRTVSIWSLFPPGHQHQELSESGQQHTTWETSIYAAVLQWLEQSNMALQWRLCIAVLMRICGFADNHALCTVFTD
jgi:hypothetical protein